MGPNFITFECFLYVQSMHVAWYNYHYHYLSCREGNDVTVDDDIIFEDFARLRLKGSDGEDGDN